MEAGRGMSEYGSRAEYVLELLNVEYKIVKSEFDRLRLVIHFKGKIFEKYGKYYHLKENTGKIYGLHWV